MRLVTVIRQAAQSSLRDSLLPSKLSRIAPTPARPAHTSFRSPSLLRKGGCTERHLLLLPSFAYCVLRSIHPCGSERGCLGLVAAGSLSRAVDLPPALAERGSCHRAAVDVLV